MKRRDLLRYGIELGTVTLVGSGLVKQDELMTRDLPLIRPPGSLSGDAYFQACIKCGRCIQACPADALGFADFGDGIRRSGAAKLVPDRAGCIAWNEECLACIDACPVDALQPVPTDDQGRLSQEEVIGRAQIDDIRCINCGQCYPICPVDAVLPEGEEDRPTLSIDHEACVGCGLCIEICPVEGKAVELYPPDAEPEYPIRMEGSR